MKTILSICTLILLMTSSLFCQVTYSTLPLDKQLIGRDLATNTGQVIIKGIVNKSGVTYTQIEIDIYRNNILINQESQTLDYVSEIAEFNFSISIAAELANYSFKIYGKNAGTRTLSKEINDIVAGDVYIIQGQSNAEARQYNGDANIYQNNFIRVFSGGFDNSTDLLNNKKWVLGQGNGNRNTLGNTGQWGLKLAHTIVNSTNIPVAIFNSAHGAKEINSFLAPTDYKTSQTSNYGRLFFRLDETNLKNYVRAVLWSQGERDASLATPLTRYKDTFNQLKSNWLTDFPNIEHFYIFQTKNGCGHSIANLMAIKEAQRQLATENSNITILSSAATTHHKDNCHLPFTNGYELFSDRLSPLILRDLYNATYSTDIDAPMITDAYLVNDTLLIIETDSKTNLEITNTAEDFLLKPEIPATITKISVINNDIIITLSNNPGTNNTYISYLAQAQGTTGNFITNSNNLELISFYEYPVGNATPVSAKKTGINQNIKLYPNPTNDVVRIIGLTGENRYKIYNTLGIEIICGTIKNHEEIDITNLVDGLYLIELEGIQTLKIIKKSYN